MLKNKKSENWAFYADDQNRHNAKRLMRVAKWLYLFITFISIFSIYYSLFIPNYSQFIPHYSPFNIVYSSWEVDNIFSVFSPQHYCFSLCPPVTNKRSGGVNKVLPQSTTAERNTEYTKKDNISKVCYYSPFTIHISRLTSHLTTNFYLLPTIFLLFT